MVKKSSGLGKGINALFTVDTIETIDLTQETIEDIQLADIRPNPYQPRKTFDEQALQELADSIKQSGVFQPVILRKSTIKGYEIVAGERRVRASKLAGKTTIPAIVRQLDETLMIEIAILENLQREDLNPLDEALAYQSMMTKLSLTQQEVSERLGKSRPYIANYLRLLSLPSEIKTLLETKALSMGQARTLLALDNVTDMIALAKKAIKESLTVRQLEELVQHYGQSSKSKKQTMSKVAKPLYIVESEELLNDKFGTSCHIVENGNHRGKIEIEYMSKSDLTRILEILNIQLD